MSRPDIIMETVHRIIECIPGTDYEDEFAYKEDHIFVQNLYRIVEEVRDKGYQDGQSNMLETFNG